MTGDTFDISRLVATTDATDLSRHDGPVGEPYPHFSLATGVQGVACTECDSTNTIANSSMRRAASRDHTQHYQCKDCSHKWFER
jgi:DNA-directed RNA polymerase subunit M/transcription elongation factor TFIIS